MVKVYTQDIIFCLVGHTHNRNGGSTLGSGENDTLHPPHFHPTHLHGLHNSGVGREIEEDEQGVLGML